MKGCIIVLLGIILLIIIGVVSLLMPKSLGVSYTPADLESIYKKVGVTFVPLPPGTPPGKSLIVSGSHPVDETFSSEEITAAADNRYKEFAYFPFRNVQIKINTDGSVEGSATVQYSDAVRYLVALGVAPKDIEDAAKKFNIPNANLPVYMKASGEVVKNKSNIRVSEAKISRIAIPSSFIQEYGPALNILIDSIISTRKPSYDIQKLSVENGKVRFIGSAPDKEQAVKRL